MTARRGRPRRGQHGIALVTVIVVLVALAVIAAPFALSMRSLESASLLGFQRAAARADAALALAAARHHLQGTHPMLDGEPARDDLAELAPPDLPSRYPDMLPRDSHGTVSSVAIEDEQGKVDLTTASPWLLGNLLGGRTSLVLDVDERAAALPVASTEGFPPAGLAWIGQELVEYSSAQRDGLGDVRRGFTTTALPYSAAVPHAAGADVLDGRLLLLAQHGWRIRPGAFDGYRRVDGLKEIALYGEQAYTADELDRVRPWLTVHGGQVRWRDGQRVLGIPTARGGGRELVVADGSRIGSGTVIELASASGEREWNLVLQSTDWGEAWHLLLLEPPALRHDAGASTVRSLVRAPVNVNTCPLPVLEALLAGLGRQPVADVVNGAEAAALAGLLVDAGLSPDAETVRTLFAPAIQQGAFSALDLVAAQALVEHDELQPGDVDAKELEARLTGLPALRSSPRLPRTAAATLAARIRAAAPDSHEALRDVVDGALAEGLITDGQREAVLRNAVDAGDAAVAGGTAPFCYASGGVFTLTAASSRNLQNGREQARARTREIVSVAPDGESAHGFATQRAFEDACRPGLLPRGWSSFPVLLDSLPGPAPPPSLAAVGGLLAGGQPSPEQVVDLLAAFGGASAGTRRPDRAGTLLGGRPGASRDEEPSFVAPSPVRSALPDTIHFDEGVPGLQGGSPRGFDFADGAVALPLAGLRPTLQSSQKLLGTFSVEFWWEVPDVDAETILFDGGSDEVEDRVLIALRDRQLLLRVDDTSIKDFEATMPEGRAPPAGEIRYAFDDGLPLLPRVPYHVLALVGGSRDRDLALFVDGVPRGRRSFTTFLTQDVPARSSAVSGVAGYGTELKLEVDSTAGFPQRGALRIGQEVVEYVDKRDDAFLVRPAGGQDPFGGRGRRGTVGTDHPASELVELLGWVAPLASERASRGNATLAGELAKFGVAELDPTQLQDLIEVEVTPLTGGGLPFTIPLGTGLTATAGTIPVRATGGLPLEAATFQPTGGHALLFCDYGRTAVAGKTVGDPNNPSGNVTLPSRTKNGWLGGMEVVRYASFDGSRLAGVQRNQSGIPVAAGGSASPLASGQQAASVERGALGFEAPREYVTTIDAALLGTGGLTGVPANPRVLVIPISVGLSGGNLHEDYSPLPDAGVPSERSALAQIDVDFPAGEVATEWFRWDTATADMLVRDDLVAVNRLIPLFAQVEVWNPDASTPGEDLLDRIGDALDFRAQDGTPAAAHASGARVLPTLLLGGWELPGFEAVGGLPGRNDGVTLVDPDQQKEWHRVNWATTRDEDWAGYGLVALRDAVTGEFVRTDEGDEQHYAVADLPLAELFESDSSARRDVLRLNADSRLFTRLLCAPSGELPTGPVAAFHVGTDFSGRPSDGKAVVDELRFQAPSTPGPLLPDTGRYVLAEDLELDEDRELRLGVEELQFPHAHRRSPLLGADVLEILSQLPQAGGLLLLGEELVGYAGLDPTGTGSVFLTARGLAGTRRAYHRRGETVQPLLAFPCSPLAGALGETGGTLTLADGGGFPPDGGLLWVDDELIGYTSRSGADLLMPSRRAGSLLPGEGLLRGRFGTAPAAHAPGAMVRWMPERYRDRALLGDDVPESECLPVSVRAPGAFFTDIALHAFLPDPSVGLAARVVLDGLGSPHDDPSTSRHVLAFEVGGGAGVGSGNGFGGAAAGAAAGDMTVELAAPVGRAADQLDLWLFAQWGPGAFDARDFRANGWKLAPEVTSVLVGHLQPDLVLEHEED